MENTYIRKAIELAFENVQHGGGPFAALIVRDGAVIATGVNQVTLSNDPTAHAEVVAIREACRVLAAFQLTDCDLYTSCEPCPMCLGAIYWARPARVFFAATREDAARAGFDDDFIYRELAAPHAARTIPALHVPDRTSLQPFEAWNTLPGKTVY
jgi:guanine deaminase